MAKKHVDWMKKGFEPMLQQFDQFTMKLPGYNALLGLTAAISTAARNDYLWANYAFQQTMQFDMEAKNRVRWRDQLFDGPATATAAEVPGIGTEFAPPAVPPVPNGIIGRWRKLVERIKKQPGYDKAIGEDLGVEKTAAPAQSMKPRIVRVSTSAGRVELNIFKDGHDALALYCKRGDETQPTLVGIYTRSRIVDDRPNLVPGQPEMREYTVEYRDNDQPVGVRSDACRVAMAA